MELDPPLQAHILLLRARGGSRAPKKPASEKGCFLAPVPRHVRASSARHTQARQSTHPAPHTRTLHNAKHDSTTAHTCARQQASHDEQAPQSPQRNGRRPGGRVSTRLNIHHVPATSRSPPPAVRMDVCASDGKPSPCRLRNSRRPDGHVRARLKTWRLQATRQPLSGKTCEHLAAHTPPAGHDPQPRRR